MGKKISEEQKNKAKELYFDIENKVFLKKYVVSQYNKFEGDLNIEIILAETPVRAIQLAIEGNLIWWEELGLEERPYDTIQEAKEYYTNSEKPIEIEKL